MVRTGRIAQLMAVTAFPLHSGRPMIRETHRAIRLISRLMHGFLSFGICVALLLTIGHAPYIYFRRYALDGKPSFLLNAALLFVVAFYVYPLEFLHLRTARPASRRRTGHTRRIGVDHRLRRA